MCTITQCYYLLEPFPFPLPSMNLNRDQTGLLHVFIHNTGQGDVNYLIV